MRRGELRIYTRLSTPEQRRVVIVVSSDGVNDSSRPWLLGIESGRLDEALRAALDL